MIGVVGGMGPHAGLELLRKVFDQTLADRDQDHLPVVLISVPEEIPDRTRFLLGEEPGDPAAVIARVLSRLEDMGVTVAGIPCNTAHAPRIFGSIRESLAAAGSRLTLLNMVEETVRFAVENLPAGCPIGVLGTCGSHRAGTYPEAFRGSPFPLLTLEDEEVAELVHLPIYHPDWGIKAQPRPASAEARSRLSEACRRLEAAGARAVILGCTELPFALPAPHVRSMVAIDPALALARALIRSLQPQKLVPLPLRASPATVESAR